MGERLNTTFSRRTSSKRRITNIANRFDQIKGEVNAHQTVGPTMSSRGHAGCIDEIR